MHTLLQPISAGNSVVQSIHAHRASPASGDEHRQSHPREHARGSDREHLCERLREQMIQLSGHAPPAHELVPTGWSDFDRTLGGGLARRGVHEWFSMGDRATLRLPPMGAFIELAWRALDHDAADAAAAVDNTGAMNTANARDRHRRIAWVGRVCHPHPHALMRGMRGVINGRRSVPDATLLARSLFIDAATPQERAWAIEQAARCPGICAVIGDGAGFDAALSRRVQLAAQGTSLVLLARLDRERNARSVALTRWLVTPRMDDASMPERAWYVHLLRSKQRTGGAL